MLHLVLMRGFPGSGKTTLAKKVAKQKDAEICSTDDFWLDEDGQYRFDPERLTEAHEWNIGRTELFLKSNKSVIVDNCNIKHEHMQPYLTLAEKYKAKVSTVVAPLNNREADELHYNNTHNVPYHIIEQMIHEWED